MIEYSKNALKKFPKPQKRKRKHEQIYGSSSSSSSEKEDRYYIYPSKANLKKAKKRKQYTKKNITIIWMARMNILKTMNRLLRMKRNKKKTNLKLSK